MDYRLGSFPATASLNMLREPRRGEHGGSRVVWALDGALPGSKAFNLSGRLEHLGCRLLTFFSREAREHGCHGGQPNPAHCGSRADSSPDRGPFRLHSAVQEEGAKPPFAGALHVVRSRITGVYT